MSKPLICDGCGEFMDPFKDTRFTMDVYRNPGFLQVFQQVDFHSYGCMVTWALFRKAREENPRGEAPEV